MQRAHITSFACQRSLRPPPWITAHLAVLLRPDRAVLPKHGRSRRVAKDAVRTPRWLRRSRRSRPGEGLPASHRVRSHRGAGALRAHSARQVTSRMSPWRHEWTAPYPAAHDAPHRAGVMDSCGTRSRPMDDAVISCATSTSPNEVRSGAARWASPTGLRPTCA
jgi:hypothetical protein